MIAAARLNNRIDVGVMPGVGWQMALSADGRKVLDSTHPGRSTVDARYHGRAKNAVTLSAMGQSVGALAFVGSMSMEASATRQSRRQLR